MAEEGLVRIVRGDPAPDELAAVLAVLLAGLRASEPAAAPPPSEWTRSARAGRHPAAGRPTVAGPGAWRASGLPR